MPIGAEQDQEVPQKSDALQSPRYVLPPLMPLPHHDWNLKSLPSAGRLGAVAVLFAFFVFLAPLPASSATVAAGESEDGLAVQKGKTQRQVAKRVYVVGDSLGVGTAPYLQNHLSRWRTIQTHAISRHAPDGVEILRVRKAVGKRYGPVIVMQLGTNDDPRNVSSFHASVKSVLAVAGRKRCVVWANVVRPKVAGATYDGYNAVFAEFASKRANLRVLDWVSLVRGNPGRPHTVRYVADVARTAAKRIHDETTSDSR